MGSTDPVLVGVDLCRHKATCAGICRARGFLDNMNEAIHWQRLTMAQSYWDRIEMKPRLDYCAVGLPAHSQHSLRAAVHILKTEGTKCPGLSDYWSLSCLLYLQAPVATAQVPITQLQWAIRSEILPVRHAGLTDIWYCYIKLSGQPRPPT